MNVTSSKRLLALDVMRGKRTAGVFLSTPYSGRDATACPCLFYIVRTAQLGGRLYPL